MVFTVPLLAALKTKTRYKMFSILKSMEEMKNTRGLTANIGIHLLIKTASRHQIIHFNMCLHVQYNFMLKISQLLRNNYAMKQENKRGKSTYQMVRKKSKNISNKGEENLTNNHNL